MQKVMRIIGLGAGELDQLSIGMYKKLKQAEKLFVRTADHPVLQELIEDGLKFESFDSIYENAESFEVVYAHITEKLINEMNNNEEVVYAVPGHPLVAEAVVQFLLQRAEKEKYKVEIEGGQSFLDPLFTAVGIDPIEGFQLLDGLSFQSEELMLEQHIIIAQVFDQMSASAVKLSLMERLPDDYHVKIVSNAGSSKELVKEVMLYELDRDFTFSNLTALYVPPVRSEELLRKEFSSLRKVIRQLRGPEGCPWDQKQTHQSLKRYLIEEAYELLEAIDNEDDEHIVEELGDVLLQVLLHAQIGEDNGYFSIEDVIGTITEKMIRRHPHVFASVSVENEEDVVSNWEAIKKEEKKENGVSEDDGSVMDGIPKELPGLLRAFKLQKKAERIEELIDVQMIEDTVQDLKKEHKTEKNAEDVYKVGSALFAFVHLARAQGIDPEEAIQHANHLFLRRFSTLEKAVHSSGKKIAELSPDELNKIWGIAKTENEVNEDETR